MCAWIIQPMDMIEPTPAQVIWVNGIGGVSVEDGVLSTYRYSLRPSLYGGNQDRVLEVILKQPLATAPESLAQVAEVVRACMSGAPSIAPVAPPGPFRPHLVR